MVKRFGLLLVLVAFTALAGCNTVEGAGEDAGNAVDKVKDVFD